MIHTAVQRRWLWSTTPAGSVARTGVARFRPARAAVPVRSGERVLGTSRLRDGGMAVATERALITVGPEGWRRHLDWADMAEAGWSSSDASTVITTWPLAHAAPDRLRLQCDQRFAAVIAERVATSQVLRRRVSLTDAVEATIVATRVTARDTAIWRVVIDAGSADDVDVTAAAYRAVAELRSLTGC